MLKTTNICTLSSMCSYIRQDFYSKILSFRYQLYYVLNEILDIIPTDFEVVNNKSESRYPFNILSLNHETVSITCMVIFTNSNKNKKNMDKSHESRS